jgi:large subunit ribosomal protein L6
MSRIGKQPIALPENVKIEINQDNVNISGPKGNLNVHFLNLVNISIEDGKILVKPTKKTDQTDAIQGLTRALIANAVTGVTEGFEKRLELVGTGYRAKKEGDKIILSLGYSHPITVNPEKEITIEIEGEKEIIIKGIDKQKVGQVAANIRKYRQPEPYKGKGIRYKDEVVRRKPGKAAKVGAAGGGA